MTTTAHEIHARITIDGADPAMPVTIHVTIDVKQEHDGIVATMPEIPGTFTIVQTREAARREVIDRARQAIAGETATIIVGS